MSESRGKGTETVGKTFSIASVVIGSYILYNLWRKWNNPDPNITIKSLYVYPVKSCKGFEVKRWKLSKHGMKYDREWLIYSPKSKRRVTQREVNTMALISVKLIFANAFDMDSVKGITFCAPKMDDIFVPIKNEFAEYIEKNKVTNITVWMDKVNGIDQGDEISKWLTNYLNDIDNNDKEIKEIKEYRLMRVSSKYHRGLNNSEQVIAISNKNVPQNLIDSAIPPYTDAFPLLLVSDSSLNEINKRLQKKNFDQIEMNQFRPNIVIQSDLNEAFIEDRISKLDLEHSTDSSRNKNNKMTTFHLRAPCPRCIMPTINQRSGKMNENHEPTMTLRQFRSGKDLHFDQQFHEKVYFGMFTVHNNYDVFIQKGDSMSPSFL